MWSVGIVLFVLLSGSQPANSNLEHKRSTCNFDDDEIWQSISLEAKDILVKLTCVEACRRPSASSLLLMAWVAQDSSENDDPPPTKRVKL